MDGRTDKRTDCNVIQQARNHDHSGDEGGLFDGTQEPLRLGFSIRVRLFIKLPRHFEKLLFAHQMRFVYGLILGYNVRPLSVKG